MTNRDDEIFYTVFPIGEYENEMPQDFSTYYDAYEYLQEEFNGCGVIESPC